MRLKHSKETHRESEGLREGRGCHTCDPVTLLRESAVCVVEVSCASREALVGKTNRPRSQE
jgi:hypothetical protein